MGEAGSLDRAERRAVVATLVREAAGRRAGRRRRLGGHAGGRDRLRHRRGGRGRRRGHAAAAARLSRRRRRGRRVLPAPWPARRDLPVMAYNNPEASGTDMGPALVAALAERRGRRRRQGVLGRRAADPRDPARDRRRAAGAGGRRRLGARGPGRGRHGLGLRRGRRRARAVRRAVGALPRERAGGRARGLPPPAAARALRHDAEARAVLQGGHRRGRPRGRALPAAPRAAARRRARRRCARRCACCTPRSPLDAHRGRLAHRGHAHARRSSPASRRCPARRCSSASCASSASATTCAMLLMREPRGHGAMSGAILQPPLRDDADWGVVFIEVSGCLPMCGHGTIGVATVLVEERLVAVQRAGDRRAPRHAGGPRRGARGGGRRPGRPR